MSAAPSASPSPHHTGWEMSSITLRTPLPSEDELDRWRSLEYSLAHTLVHLESKLCNVERVDRPRHCVYVRKIELCIAAARFGLSQPNFTILPQLVEFCSRESICSVFKKNGNSGSQKALAHIFWCSGRGPRSSTPLISFLTFDVCNDVPSRDALIHGLMIGQLANLSTVLPVLNGRFDEYYDRAVIEVDFIRRGARVASRADGERIRRSRADKDGDDAYRLNPGSGLRSLQWYVDQTRRFLVTQPPRPSATGIPVIDAGCVKPPVDNAYGPYASLAKRINATLDMAAFRAQAQVDML
eukprot:scaffold93804_cov35-Tisochrysis_lutea.AAC.1